MSKTISIAICNYNRSRMVLRCIECAIASAGDQVEICVVDNASTDGSPEIIRNRFKDEVRLYVEPVNGGSSGGFYRAVDMALESNPKYVFLLDSDCLIAPNTIPVLLSFLCENPSFSGVGPKLYWPEPTGLVQELGGNIDWIKAECNGNYKNYNETIEPVLSGLHKSDYVPTCALMIRANEIYRHGNIDDRFFLYFDDVEWQWRMKLGGGRIAASGDTWAVHYCGASRKTDHRPTYYHWRNRIHFFRKYTPEYLKRETLRKIVDDAIRAVATCRTFDMRNAAGSIVLGVLDGFKGRWREGDLSSIDLTIDPEKKILPIRWDKLPVQRVNHVFENANEKERYNEFLILEDDFGKRITAAQAWDLTEKYREEKVKASQQFSHAQSVGMPILTRF